MISIAYKARFTSGLICMCTYMPGTAPASPVRSHSDPNFPYIMKNNNNTTNKVAFEALPTHTIEGPYADTFEFCSHLHKCLHPLYCYLPTAEKEKNTVRMSTEIRWWGEVGEATTPFVRITRSEVGVAPTGATPIQNSAKISQLLSTF